MKNEYKKYTIIMILCFILGGVLFGDVFVPGL